MGSNKNVINKNSDDTFEVTISEESLKLLTPVAILIASILVSAALIYATSKITESLSVIKDLKINQSSSTTTNTNNTNNTNEQPQTNFTKSDKPQLLLFTMSYCPYGNQAEDVVKPVFDLLKDKIDFEPHYVIYSKYATSINNSYKQQCSAGYKDYCNVTIKWSDYCSSEDEKYCSMHGAQELNEDVRELCIWRDQQDKYWDYVMAVNTGCTYQNVDSCWENIATSKGVDVNKVKSCYNNDYNSLLASEVELNTKYSVDGSPAILVNGTSYTAARDSEILKKSICSSFNSQPDQCGTTLTTTTNTNTDGGCG